MKHVHHFLLTGMMLLCGQVIAQKQSPKLVVGIVIDQMRYDYLLKYYDQYGDNGFRRMMNGGVNFHDCRYNYTPTYTGCGHASIYTGATPSLHGIVGNDWYRSNHKDSIYCAQDNAVLPLGTDGKQGHRSPVNLLSTTIGDEMKLFTQGKSKVFGISLKDRGSILPAGHMADAAYWFDAVSGKWISSSYYMKELPAWVQAFNQEKRPDQYLETPWTTLYPIGGYTASSEDNDPSEEAFKGEKAPVFPHNLKAISKATPKKPYEIIFSSPAGTSISFEFAKQLLQQEKLGKGTHTDMLALSISSTDYVGHKFGPNSVENQDMYLRLDKELGDFISFLDQSYGIGNVVIFITADHAAGYNPAQLKAQRIPSGNFHSGDAWFNDLKKKLTEVFGAPLITTCMNQQLYLDKTEISARNLSVEKVYQVVREYMLTYPAVREVYNITAPGTQYLSNEAVMCMNGVMNGRSGDIMIIYKPGWVDMDWSEKGTTHGSPYSYDTRVPLLFYGYGIPQKDVWRNVEITDIAATVTALIGCPFPSASQGYILPEVLENRGK